MDNLSFKNWLMEVGSSGGIGGGMPPQQMLPQKYFRSSGLGKPATGDPMDKSAETNAFMQISDNDKPPCPKRFMKSDTVNTHKSKKKK